MVGLGMPGFRQRLRHSDNDKEHVENGDSGSQRHDETITVEAAEIRTDGWARHQTSRKCC